ncbi:extracellular solute-binding protein [Leifsonia kafniensis]|uniref:Extracellular solute-binding protein n=1 Tax=Leifsonia kafniensis TaxID=475957 RepID=A0ABP7KHF0_9MICO
MMQMNHGNGRRMRRTLIAGGVTAALALSLGGCATASNDAPAAVDGGGLGTADKPVEITMIANDGYAKQWQENMVPEFNKEFPNIKVNIEGVPYGDQLSKTLLEMTAPEPRYDIVMADDNWIPQIASTGGLLDLKAGAAAWTDEDYDWDDFYPAALAAGEWDGKQYGVPTRSNLLMMFTNKSLYEKAGLEAPTPEITWDEYMEQAPKLVQDTDGDGAVDAWAVGTYFVRDSLTPTIWQTILNSNGGKLLDDDGTVAFDNKKGVEALQTQMDLLQYAPPGASTWQFNEPLEAFRQGRLATMFTWGSVYRGTAVDPTTTTLTPEQVGIQTLPVGSASAGAHRGVWSAAISSKSAHPEASWALVQWLTSKAGEKWQSNTLGVFPARQSTLNSTPEQEWLVPVFAAIKEGFEAVDAGQMWRPRMVESDAVQQILADQTGEAIPGQITAQEAVDTMSADITKLLK